MDFHGFSLIFMDFHGFSLISLIFNQKGVLEGLNRT